VNIPYSSAINSLPHLPSKIVVVIARLPAGRFAGFVTVFCFGKQGSRGAQRSHEDQQVFKK
jgi:hypothetical protein